MTTVLVAASGSPNSTAGAVVAVVVGAVLVAAVLVSALETVVLPRNAFTRISRATFAVADRVLVHTWRDPKRSAHIRGLYAPVALVSLPLVWMILVILGFSAIFWGIGSGTWTRSLEISGSSVTTLGFAAPAGAARTWVTFIEAIIGLGLVALLISYLPTIYGAYHNREKGLRTIRPFAGTPPSGVALLLTLDRYDALDNGDLWRTASAWLLELDQTHCAFPALAFFPETADGQSWVASVGSLLDAGALLLSTTSIEPQDGGPIPHQGPVLVLASGLSAAVEVARACGLPIDPPRTLLELFADAPTTPPDISVTREEYVDALDRLGSIVQVADEDREAAWLRFATVRAAYDRAIRGLAGVTLAAPAPWTTDRPAVVGRPRLLTNRPITVDWSPPPATD